MLELLEDEGARAFADNKAVAAAVKRARGMRRIVVPVGAGGKKRVKDRGIGGVELLAAACDHQRLSAGCDRFVGRSDALRAGSACRTGRNDAALAAEGDRDVHRCGVRHHAHIGRRGDAAAAFGENHVREFCDGSRLSG